MAIRDIAIMDAEAAARLSAELGYPVSADTIRRRIENLRNLKDHAVLVACQSDVLAGWIDVGIIHHIQSEPYGEIGGLIVSSDYRSTGIGTKLVAEAERWVAARGFKRILVRSQVTRDAAHRFYLRRGYTITKTSAVFSKALS